MISILFAILLIFINLTDIKIYKFICEKVDYTFKSLLLLQIFKTFIAINNVAPCRC